MQLQLLVVILNKTECMPDILSRLMAEGIGGTTIVDCEGMLQVISKSQVEPPPIFGSLRQFLNPGRQAGKLLLTVLGDGQIAVAKKIIDEAVGGIEKPGTGIVFTLPITSAEGLCFN